MPPRIRTADLPAHIRERIPVDPPAPARRPSARRGPSPLEAAFARQATAAGLPAWECEYRFDHSRRWRLDFAWPERLLAVEIEGGTHSGGRHTRGAGYAADCDKYNAAALAGWRVLRFTGCHLREPHGGMSPAIEATAKAIETLR